jgi:pimeloyl-ACP methyl ester carboxylesterase
LATLQIVLLPGLDGTGTLFKRFVAAVPEQIVCKPIRLPVEPLTYDELTEAVAAEVPAGATVVAESFSRPLAVALACRVPLAGLVFCNSFVDAPRSRALKWIPWHVVFRFSPPRSLLRRYVVGSDADDGLVGEVAEVVSSVPANVLASRVDAVLSVDAVTAFGQVAAPMLYLRGTEDRLVPETAWHRMAALRPIRTVHVPGPHLLLQANPTGSWQAVATFVDSLPAV